jgi:hypothetical protein
LHVWSGVEGRLWFPKSQSRARRRNEHTHAHAHKHGCRHRQEALELPSAYQPCVCPPPPHTHAPNLPPTHTLQDMSSTFTGRHVSVSVVEVVREQRKVVGSMMRAAENETLRQLEVGGACVSRSTHTLGHL